MGLSDNSYIPIKKFTVRFTTVAIVMNGGKTNIIFHVIAV